MYMPVVQIPTFPFYAIFILVLIISANFLAQLFPCRFQQALQTNMYIKHLFGLLTLNFFVLLSMPEFSSSLYEGVKSSALLYAAFMVITRTDTTIFYLILLLLGISYLVNLNINILVTKTEKDETAVVDNAGKTAINSIYNPRETDQTITQENKTIDDIEFYKKMAYYINIITVVLTFIGFILHLGEKKYEHKSKFSYLNFMFGQTECLTRMPHISYLTAMKYAFVRV
jgi:hypothetical protein